MLQSKTRWNIQTIDQDAVNVLTEKLNITPLVARLLVNRGIDTVESARSFLFMENLAFHDPFLLEGMDRAVQRIREAIEKNEKMSVLKVQECGVEQEFLGEFEDQTTSA